jgi:hypothetical protein
MHGIGILAQLIKQESSDQHAAGKTNCQPKNINERKNLIFQ